MTDKAAEKSEVKFIKSVKYVDVESVLSEEFGDSFRSYRVDYKDSLNYDKHGRIPDFPLTVSLELVNRCNLDCIMCFTINHKDPKSTLDLKTVSSVMDECSAHGLPAAVIGMGSEILVYKDAMKVVETVRNAGVMDLFFGTNGVLLSEDISEFLVQQKVARIEISLDAATPETYLRVRRKDELEKVERNIEKLLEIRKRNNSKLPVIRLCFCVQPENVHEQQAFLDKWKDKVDYIDFQEMIDFGDVDDLRSHPAPFESDAEPSLADSHCAYPFNSLHVWSNGDVTPCCTFFGKALVLGNVKGESLEKIWRGEKIDMVRKQLLSGEVNPVCRACLTHRDKESFSKANAGVSVLSPAE